MWSVVVVMGAAVSSLCFGGGTTLLGNPAFSQGENRKSRLNSGGGPEQLGLGEILIPAPLEVEMLVTCYLVMSYVASIVDDAVPF